ncbi:MAG: hypothetical protein KC931_27405, partial [Candidatus Omnitrophica bacterium]|nr:hypothetical protein [Candidatus Omnitrophota bacterium]
FSSLQSAECQFFSSCSSFILLMLVLIATRSEVHCFSGTMSIAWKTIQQRSRYGRSNPIP